MTVNVLELATTVPSELTCAQRQRLIESIARQLADDERRRLLSMAAVLANDFTLADYEVWFREAVE